MFGQNSGWGQSNQQNQQQTGGGMFGATAGGFGQQQQQPQQQATGFGQTNTGFGQPPQQNTGGIFGAAANTNTGGGFGFNANTNNTTQNNTFGARPGFGATGGSTFGQAAPATGGGLFGGNNASTSTFGQQNTNTLFGKPATTTSTFGSGATSNLFGAKPANSSPFGSTSTSQQPNINMVHQYTNGPFPPPPQTGTAQPAYHDTWQQDASTVTTGKEPPPHLFHVISAMEPFKGASYEELRAMDYQQGRKDASATAAAGPAGFGAPAATGFGQTQPTTGFGQQPAASTSTFGQPKPGGLFGASTTGTTGFGTTSTGFGATANTNTGGGLFGAQPQQQQQQQQQQTSMFGQSPSTTTTGGVFGQPQQQQNQQPGGLFGAASTNVFGAQPQQQQQQAGTSGFGGGFGAPKTTFGAAPATTGFGQPAAQATNTFGQPAQQAGTTGFGFGQNQQQQQQPQQQATGLFGGSTFGATSTQNTAGSSLFGQPNQQQQQQPAAGGLFGQSNAAKPGGLFGAPATTQPTTGTFGFGAQTTTPQQPTAGGGLFGANTQQNAGTGMFGQQNQTQQPNAQPGGLFGAAGTSSLFGQKPATTAPTTGLFGAAQPAQQPAQGGGLFGGNTGQTTGLFGGGTNTFGQQNQQTDPAKPAGGLFGGTGGLFGSQTHQPAQQAGTTGGMFGSTLGQSQPAQNLFGGAQSTQTGQAGGMFAGSTFGQPQGGQQQPQLVANIDQNPYGNNPLFNYNGQKLDLGASTKKPALPPLTSSSFRLTPKKGPVNKLRGFASPLTSSQQSPARIGSPLNGLTSPNRSFGSPVGTDRYKGLTETALTPNAFVPRPSIKKLTVTPKSLYSNSNSEDHLDAVLGKSALRSSNSSSGYQGPATPGQASTPQRPEQGTTNSHASQNKAIEGSSTRQPEQNRLQSSTSVPTPSSGQPQKGDYWCRPRLEKLKQLSTRELSEIDNFTAGRKGYGEVSFLHPVDLTGVDLDTFLGDALVFSDMELAVYPDTYHEKPPPGKGLNQPAQITLENCFTKDKATKKNITDSNDPRYGRFVKRIKSIPETEFVGYTSNGEWTFKVEHFSRYGCKELVDDDDDDDSDGNGNGGGAVERLKARSLSPAGSAGTTSTGEEGGSDEEDGLPPTKSLRDIEHDSGLDESASEDEDDAGGSETSREEGIQKRKRPLRHSDDDDDEEEEDYDDETYDDDERSTTSRSRPTPHWEKPIKARIGEMGLRKIQQMQNSGFFLHSPKQQTTKVREIPMEKAAILRARKSIMESLREKNPRASTTMMMEGREDFGRAEGRDDLTRSERDENEIETIRRASFGDNQLSHDVSSQSKPHQAKLRVPRKYTKVALKDSIVTPEATGIRMDAGLALGRSFRCSWGPNGELVHFGKICGPNTEFAPPFTSQVFIEQVELLSEPNSVEKTKAKRLLELQLARSVITYSDGELSVVTDPLIRFSNFANLFQPGDRGHEANVFRLGQALFDEIDLKLPSDSSDELVDRIAAIRRKLALSKWLENAVAPSVDSDLVNTESQPSKIFAYLSGNQLDRAVQSAIEGKDMRLATLISQAGGPDTFKQQVQRQLDEWTKYKANSHISKEYRRIYALLGGITDIYPGNPSRGVDFAGDVKISEGLDWKRAFGLRLWYGNNFEDSIGDVFMDYTSSLESSNSPAPPLPPYLENAKNLPDQQIRKWNTPTTPTDIIYNLIRLYSDTAISLDQTLNPRDAGPSPMDYRVIWYLYILLSRVMKKRDFEDRDVVDGYSALADRVAVGFATQLEEAGEWVWAIFVLMHLEAPRGRETAIKAVLHRHPEPSIREVERLTTELKIPSTWIYQAKADLLASRDDAYGEYNALISAQSFDRAHRILINKLLPEAVLRNDTSLIKRLCAPLENRVDGWSYGGKLFLDYANIVDQSEHFSTLLRSGDTASNRTIREMAATIPRLLQLLPSVFPSRGNSDGEEDLQSVATLGDMLSRLHTLAGLLASGNIMSRPAITPLLVDADRLHLLQSAAFDTFSRNLDAAVMSGA